MTKVACTSGFGGVYIMGWDGVWNGKRGGWGEAHIEQY